MLFKKQNFTSSAMDNNSNNKLTEQWKVAGKRDNRQKGNNNGDKPKNSPESTKTGKKFARGVKIGVLKGKIVTVEGENSATQFKDLLEAAVPHFCGINGKVEKKIGKLTKLQQIDSTPKAVNESQYKDADGTIDQDKKKAVDELHLGLVKNAVK